jgi:non-ribosomal peptide synthetase component F/3-oxoacyl-(acyl-carrier-protein) synthase
MSRDIAIIGMSARFPDAATIQQFYRNLREGRDSVKEMPTEMVRERTLPPDKEYTAMGFLADIDKFDHQFFNIPVSEAQHMDPVQRMLMEVAYETFESSGYNPDFFDNTRTVLYLSHADYNYVNLLMHRIKDEPTMFTGNNHFAAAGRISRFFNLRGNATVVNNGCSSALNAVHLACNELIYGEADYALAMGARITIMCAEKNPEIFDLGIEAFDGKTRSFSDDSNGSGEAEMIGCILLKPLDKALADKDHIYAVIRSTVANQSAQLASSLTATNSVAQSEMIREAWKKAGVDPLTVTQVETHGSGTRLGDPIEIAGIDMAFQGITDKKHFVAVGSVKTNIGHADTGAGMAGLMKAALSVKHGEIFPSLNFRKPNPFIDFENSVTYVNTTLQKWEPECGVRRAGVNSLGFTGNNVHVLLENPAERAIAKDTSSGPYLFVYSSKTPEGLKRNISAFLEYLRDSADQLRDISFTLTAGRRHYEYRCAVVASSREELTKALEAELGSSAPRRAAEPFKKLVYVFSDDTLVPPQLLASLREQYPLFREKYDTCAALAGVLNENTRRFAFQYALYSLLVENGLSSGHLVGLGTGKQVIAAITGKTTLEEAVKAAAGLPSEAPADLPKRLEALVEKETGKENVLFVEVGPEAGISGTLRTINSLYKDLFAVSSLNMYSPGPLAGLLREIYLLNYAIDWERYAQQNRGYRVVLPAYQFEKTRCWIGEPGEVLAIPQSAGGESYTVAAPEETSAPYAGDFPDDWTLTEKKVGAIWASILKTSRMKLHDDFFALGGHSLFLIQVNNRIEQEFSFKFEIKELFAFATIKSLAQAIDMLAAGKGSRRSTIIQPVGPREHYPLSLAQKRLWILSQFPASSVAYNLPLAFRFEGRIHKRAFSKAFDTVIERHETLRTIFTGVEGEPVQKILSPSELSFSITETDLTEHPDREAEALRLAELDAVTPFDLARGPLVRAGLLKLEDTKHLLVFNMHHIIGDGWSSNVLIQEILSLYEAYSQGQPNTLMPLRIQYKDYAAWQLEKLSGEELNTHREYWLNRFSGPLPVLDLPSDKLRPAIQTFNGDMHSFVLDRELSARVSELNRDFGVTLFMTLLSTLKALFYHYSGNTDIIIGSPSAGRDNADLENQVGFYINTLALRSTFSPQETFADLLDKVKQNTLGAYEHQLYPLDRLVEELNLERDMSRSALFDIILILHNIASGGTQELAGIRATPVTREHKVSQRDMTFNFFENDGQIEGSIEYNTDIYSREWIEGFIAHFKSLLDQVTDNPHASLQQYRLPLQEVKEKYTMLKASGEKRPAVTTPAPVPVNAPFVEPASETERRVAEIICQVLSRPRVSLNDNFFEIGGHSLKAMRLIFKLNKELNVKIGLVTMYSHPTIGELARVIAEARQNGGIVPDPVQPQEEKKTYVEQEEPRLTGIPVQELYDVSYAQLNFLTENQLVEDNIPGRLPLGVIDEEAFVKTWDALIERHESFRTVFLRVNGVWKQKLLPASDPRFRLQAVDLTGSATPEEEAAAITKDIFNRTYDFENGPLLTGILLRHPGNEYELLYTLSHAVADGWTMNILKSDLDAIYGAFTEGKPNPLAPLPVQVKDYAAWQHRMLSHSASQPHREYWHSRLHGKLPKLNLPQDYTGATEPGDYAVYKLAIDGERMRKIYEFNSRHGNSLFSLMLATLNILLYRLTGQKDVLITIAGATRDHEELQNVVGFFVNSMLIRTQLQDDKPFRQYLSETSQEFVEAISHQVYPLEKLFSELDFGVKDFTPVLLNTHNYPGQELGVLEDTAPRHEPTTLKARVHLGCIFDEFSNCIGVNWLYRTNMFKPETIEEISSRFLSLLDEAVAEPDARIRKLGITVEKPKEVS